MDSIKHLADVAKPIFTVDICAMVGSDVLMFKRSDSKKVFPGWLALPGGHIEEGEDPLAAAMREIKEETGIGVDSGQMQLKFIALHHHIDRNELFSVFGYVAHLLEKPDHIAENGEGKAEWVSKDALLARETVFPPVRYYFPHIFSNTPGILYNYSIWNNSKLVRVVSEHLDRNS